MVYLALEVAEATVDTDRFDEENNVHWEPIMSAQAKTEAEAKALMLDNVLEALNSSDLDPFQQWVRLVKFDKDNKTRMKVETF